jgi:hypothetical protein
VVGLSTDGVPIIRGFLLPVTLGADLGAAITALDFSPTIQDLKEGPIPEPIRLSLLLLEPGSEGVPRVRPGTYLFSFVDDDTGKSRTPRGFQAHRRRCSLEDPPVFLRGELD